MPFERIAQQTRELSLPTESKHSGHVEDKSDSVDNSNQLTLPKTEQPTLPKSEQSENNLEVEEFEQKEIEKLSQMSQKKHVQNQTPQVQRRQSLLFLSRVLI